MTNYHLLPHGDHWNLTSDDREAICAFETKREALETCTQIMFGRMGSLTIHRSDGTIQEKRSFPGAFKELSRRSA